MTKSVALFACAMLVCCVAGPLGGSGRSQALGSGQLLDGSSGGRTYKLYLPGSYAGAPLPLVMMLHGCTQDASTFVTSTRMNAVAEENGFLVLYPDQPSSIQSLKCWSWFDAANQKRGSGEPAALVAMLDQVAAMYAVDAHRVYSAGLSAGAAMSVILAATYPDRFAGIGVASGVEYAAATGGVASSGAVQSSGGPDPAQQGQAAFDAMGASHRPLPVIVFHGTADGIVAPVNGDQVIAQWQRTDDLAGAALPAMPDAAEPMTAPGGRSFTTSTWLDQRGGTPMLRKVLVTGMGHAWSGGDSAGSFADPMGPNASEMIWAFFSGAPSPGGGGSGGSGGGGSDAMPHASGCSFVPGQR